MAINQPKSPVLTSTVSDSPWGGRPRPRRIPGPAPATYENQRPTQNAKPRGT